MKTWLQGLFFFVGTAVTTAYGGVIDIASGQVTGDMLYSFAAGEQTAHFSANGADSRFYRDSASTHRERGEVALYLETGHQARSAIPDLTDNNPPSFDFNVNALATWSVYLDSSHTDADISVENLHFSHLPEPGTYALFGIGLLGFAYARRQMD